MAEGKYKTDPTYDDDIDFIKDSDAVQGDPAATDPDTVALTGPINVVVQKIVSSLAYLKNAVDNFSISRMTDTVFGTGKTATQAEAEAGTAHGTGGPVLTPLRGKQNALATLRSSDAQSSTSQRGSAEIATQDEARGGTDNERIMTSLRVQDFLRNGTGAIANQTRKGTVQFTALDAAIGTSPPTTKVVSASIIQSMIKELAPVLKTYTGIGAVSVTINGTSRQVIATTTNFTSGSPTEFTLPSGETYLGGLAWTRAQVNDEEGHRTDIVHVNNHLCLNRFLHVGSDTTVWQIWTQEN